MAFNRQGAKAAKKTETLQSALLISFPPRLRASAPPREMNSIYSRGGAKTWRNPENSVPICLLCARCAL